MVKWEFSDDRAIYSQIIEQVKLAIISGTAAPGTKLASVRELAAEARVNPNTMQKALSELERDGLVFTNRTSGRFITDNTALIASLRREHAAQTVAEFLKNMESIGVGRSEAAELVLGMELTQGERMKGNE